MTDAIEIRCVDRTASGGMAVDEVIAKNADIHLERMSNSGVWIGIKTATEYLHVRLWTKWQRIEISATRETR